MRALLLARGVVDLTAPLVLSVAAALVVQIGVMIFQLLLGTQMPVSELIVSVLLPTLALTALLSAPVLLVGQRLLGPRRRATRCPRDDARAPQRRTGLRAGSRREAGRRR